MREARAEILCVPTWKGYALAPGGSVDRGMLLPPIQKLSSELAELLSGDEISRCSPNRKSSDHRQAKAKSVLHRYPQILS